MRKVCKIPFNSYLGNIICALYKFFLALHSYGTTPLLQLLGCTVTMLHGYKAARLQGCTVTRLHGYNYKAARLQGCTVTRLHGYKAAWLQGCGKAMGLYTQPRRGYMATGIPVTV